MSDDLHEGKFPGFPAEASCNFWQYPKIMNGWWSNLSPIEQKVLDYILRHTWGYQKTADSISISQFIQGIRKSDGSVVDNGTGIKDERTVRSALKSLQSKGYISSEFVLGRATRFQLKIQNPSQQMLPLSSDEVGVVARNVGGDPPQAMSPTIDKKTIKTYTKDYQVKKQKVSTEIARVIAYLSSRLSVQFPNYAKQAKYAKAMFDAQYTVEDITWAIDKMSVDPWWLQNSFDMKNVADQIPKLMTKTFPKESRMLIDPNIARQKLIAMDFVQAPPVFLWIEKAWLQKALDMEAVIEKQGLYIIAQRQVETEEVVGFRGRAPVTKMVVTIDVSNYEKFIREYQEFQESKRQPQKQKINYQMLLEVLADKKRP